MKKFDKKIKNLAKEFQAPDTYHQRADEILENIQKDSVSEDSVSEDSVSAPKRKTFVKVAIVMVALCLVITGYLRFSKVEVAEASFLATFKQTILDFLGMGQDEAQEMGIESEKEEAVSKPDLLIKLQEVVMDTQNIYAVVNVTAPSDLEFNEEMTFDYFGFCEGANYSDTALVPGAKDCTLLETLEGKKNVATFVVDIATPDQIEEGKEVTVFFKDLIAGFYEDTPDVLVEGMWSVSFTSSYTDSEDITIKGTEDMKYSVLDTTVAIKKIKLLPLGITIDIDISNVPADIWNTTNTDVTIRFKMIDGSEQIVDSSNFEDETLVSSSDYTQYEKKEKTFERYVGQFKNAIDINKIFGIYVGDCYIPLKEYNE